MLGRSGLLAAASFSPDIHPPGAAGPEARFSLHPRMTYRSFRAYIAIKIWRSIPWGRSAQNDRAYAPLPSPRQDGQLIN
jgi:hypothetical protein